MQNIKPLSDHVFIEPIEDETTTESGIVIPDTADKERPMKGKVVAVGEGKRDDDGKLIPMSVKIGDVVLFKKYGLAHTFWIDDLTISGYRPIQKFQKLLNKIFTQEGFILHDDPKKTKFTSSKERQTCTGLVINQEPNAEKSVRERVRKELYLCTKFGVENYLKDHELAVEKEKYLMSLRGKISFLTAANKKNMIFKEQFAKL